MAGHDRSRQFLERLRAQQTALNQSVSVRPFEAASTISDAAPVDRTLLDALRLRSNSHTSHTATELSEDTPRPPPRAAVRSPQPWDLKAMDDLDKYRPMGQRDAVVVPMLGYDWIAGMFDNTRDGPLEELSDEFFESIDRFRKVHQSECIAPTPPGGFDDKLTTRGTKDTVKGPHTEIAPQPAFKVNERLHPIEVGGDSFSSVPAPLASTLGKFMRVSIPKAVVKEPPQEPPPPRKAFNPTESCALQQHCVLGWELSRPAASPKKDTLDLNSSLRQERSHGPSDLAEFARTLRLSQPPPSRGYRATALTFSS